MKLAFFKIIVSNLAVSRSFYEEALGFIVETEFDTPEFAEIIMRQADGGCGLILLAYKDGRAFPDATTHGPTGFLTQEIEAAHAQLVAMGATPKGPILEVEGGIKVAFLADPDGHEIEICQFP